MNLLFENSKSGNLKTSEIHINWFILYFSDCSSPPKILQHTTHRQTLISRSFVKVDDIPQNTLFSRSWGLSCQPLGNYEIASETDMKCVFPWLIICARNFDGFFFHSHSLAFLDHTFGFVTFEELIVSFSSSSDDSSFGPCSVSEWCSDSKWMMSDVLFAGSVAYLALFLVKFWLLLCVSSFEAITTFFTSFLDVLGFDVGAHLVSLLAL